jgi:hypothetical protein
VPPAVTPRRQAPRRRQHEPEPFSNWFLSLAEDAFRIGLSFITLKYPPSPRRQRGDLM